MKRNRLFSFGMACILTAACLPCRMNAQYAASASYSQAETNALTIKKYTDHAAVTSCARNATFVTIPDTYDNLPVTEIENYAFEGCSRLVTVHIPDSITRIEALAFASCLTLASVTGGQNVTYVGSNAFYHTPWLKDFQKQEKPAILGTVMLDGSTYSQETIVLPSEIHMVASDVFFENTAIRNIIVPKKVDIVGDAAFDCVTNLEVIAFLNPHCEMNLNAPMGIVSNGHGRLAGDYFYNGTILGYVDSTAHQLAQKENYRFRQFGDCNGDDTVNITDAIVILKCFAQELLGDPVKMHPLIRLCADVDHNDAINQQDATILLRYCTFQMLEEPVGLDELIP